MHDKVSRLRQLMSEALPAATPYVVFPSNCSGLTENSELEQTPRARSIRRILRIVETHHWPQVLESALDDARVSSLAELDEPSLADLLGRLLQLQDCAEMGADTLFAPGVRY